MRILPFLNNWGGLQLARWLRLRKEEIVGLVVQPEGDQRFAAEIRAELELPADRVWLASDLRQPETLAAIGSLRPNIGITGWFGYILRPELLNLFSDGVVNLHSAYLPWNRGWHTNVWPILDGSPAGVTVMYIDPGVDTGDLIAQRRIGVTSTDTGESLHKRLTYEMISLFQETWPLIVSGTAVRTPQLREAGSHHKRNDLANIDRIDLERSYSARSLLNLLRARTYFPYPAAYYVVDGLKVFVRVEFSEQVKDLDQEDSKRRAAVEIDIDRNYSAKDFLRILEWPGTAFEAPAYLKSESRVVYVRSHLVNEKDLQPQGNPRWLPAADALSMSAPRS